MKFQVAFVAWLVVVGFVGQASAQSNCSQDNGRGRLVTLHSGTTVCAKLPAERAQEYHVPGGDLWDHKLGAGDAVDPFAKVGNGSVTSGPIGSSDNTAETAGHAHGGTCACHACQTASTYALNATDGSTTLTGATPSSSHMGCAP